MTWLPTLVSVASGLQPSLTAHFLTVAGYPGPFRCADGSVVVVVGPDPDDPDPDGTGPV